MSSFWSRHFLAFYILLAESLLRVSHLWWAQSGSVNAPASCCTSKCFSCPQKCCPENPKAYFSLFSLPPLCFFCFTSHNVKWDLDYPIAASMTLSLHRLMKTFKKISTYHLEQKTILEGNKMARHSSIQTNSSLHCANNFWFGNDI